MNEMRSNVTNEIDQRKDLKLGENKVDVCVALSLGFSTCPPLSLVDLFL